MPRISVIFLIWISEGISPQSQIEKYIPEIPLPEEPNPPGLVPSLLSSF